MKMSNLYMPTLREAPTDTEIASYRLMLRSGMIRKVVAGVFSYLPLGYRVIRKIENIVREEMDNSGGQETLMPNIQPKELWDESGRLKEFGTEMLKINDSHNRELCLSPSNEEIFIETIKNELKSYKQLPLNLYQIQSKYRDEKRPRLGVIRSREFISKDAYTFDKDAKSMEKSYMNMWKAYERIFDRCKIDYRVLQADSGQKGNGTSHQFSAKSDIGETGLVYCKDCNYAATDEKAPVIYNIKNNTQKENIKKEEVHTPHAVTVQKMEEYLGMDASNFVKTLLFKGKEKVIAVLIPADRELNQSKLANYLNLPESEIEMIDEEGVKRVTGAEIGFAGPLELKEDVRMIIDSRIKKMKNFVVGANKTDYHIKNVNIEDFSGEEVEDLLLVKKNDTCPKCKSKLLIDRGIKLGNLLQLGTEYSEKLNARYLDENGKSQNFYMNSFGLGIDRTIGAIIEQNNDEKGMIWPLAVAPYHLIVTVVNPKKEDQIELATSLYDVLKKEGIEVLLDDRKERAGVKFTDAELIGIPIRITVGRDAKDSVVEFSLREEYEKVKVNEVEVLKRVKEVFENQGLKL
ncbi:MAG: proline--tRNA ligase [Senegalia sp. (in: firmicutes)]